MSTVLSRDSDYQYPPQPAPAPWTREIADAVHLDIAQRLRALEAKRTELQDLVDDLSFFGIQRLDSAINPLIAEVTAEVAALQKAVADTLAANNRIISDFQAVTAVNLGELQAQIDDVQERMNVILAGGLGAADVRESADRVFVTPAQRTEIGRLRTAVNALPTSTTVNDRDAVVASLAHRRAFFLANVFRS